MPDRVFTIDINVPIQRVWDEITTPGRVCRPMFDTILDGMMTPGGKMRYRSANGKFVFILGEVRETVPPQGGQARLVHTFKFTHLPDDYSLVTWELSSIAGGTRVKLVHQFASENKTYNMVQKGWNTILGNFKAVLETGNLPLGQRIQYGMMHAMSFMTPKAMRVENVRE
ncbi:MAG TPA: SRPBCC domain-containing protein [Phycisphaerales bacterium]|nr:SRPBCC domain-containing protein [Phycisphaerales bacterium]